MKPQRLTRSWYRHNLQGMRPEAGLKQPHVVPAVIGADDVCDSYRTPRDRNRRSFQANEPTTNSGASGVRLLNRSPRRGVLVGYGCPWWAQAWALAGVSPRQHRTPVNPSWRHRPGRRIVAGRLHETTHGCRAAVPRWRLAHPPRNTAFPVPLFGPGIVLVGGRDIGDPLL